MIDQTDAQRHTETRLDSLEKYATEQNQRLGVVETQLKGIGADVKSLVSTVANVTARPQTDWIKIITAAAALVVIIGATGSVITYIASNVNAVATAKLETHSARQEERLQFMQLRLDRGWFSASEMKIRAPGGAVTPQ